MVARQVPWICVKYAALLAVLAGSLLSSAGCITTTGQPSGGTAQANAAGPFQPAGKSPVCNVAATWKPGIATTPDPIHNGEPLPGFMGKVYLFGAQDTLPISFDGDITVEMYLDPPAAATPPSNGIANAARKAPDVSWHLNSQSLALLRKKDPIGMGYSLFLPWQDYKPDIKHVELRLRFEPPGCYPIYAEPVVVSLNRDFQFTHKESTQALPPHGNW